MVLQALSSATNHYVTLPYLYSITEWPSLSQELTSPNVMHFDRWYESSLLLMKYFI